ncbi:MAG: hypothetical protein ACREE4_05945 [Stellaceae bacterium]
MIDFLRSAAQELRRLADVAPDIAEELHTLADSAEARADALDERGSSDVC